MKLTLAISLFFALFTLVATAAVGPNAERMRRGLPPLAPRQPYEASRVDVARRAQSSPTPGQCNTGPVQCCQTVTTSSDPVAKTLIGLLGIVIQGVNVPVGLNCSPISAIGIGGNSCSANPVCCSNNSFHGLIAIGCVPVNLNL